MWHHDPDFDKGRFRVPREKVDCALALPGNLSFPFVCLLAFVQILVWNWLIIDDSRADTGLAYEVSIQGVSDRQLLKTLRAVSKTLARRDRPPATLKFLQRRVEEDVELFQKALRAQGYYAAEVMTQIKKDTEPVQVNFTIDQGPPYILEKVDIRLAEGTAPGLELPKPEKLGLELGEPAESQSILDGEKALIQRFRNKGYPFSKIADRRVVVDHAVQEVTVTFQVEPGPQARFGKIEIEGLETVKKDYLLAKIPWEQGDLYRAELLSKAQRRLRRTGLLGTVRAQTGDQLDEKGRLPVAIRVKERKHRSIKGGLGYRTNEGFGGRIGWEHRNLFGRGEFFDLNLIGSEIAYAVESNFRKPVFMHEDQSLLATFRFGEDHPDAFTSRNIDATALIERQVQEDMIMGAGLAFRASDVDQRGEEENFGLIYLPVHFDWDTRDDLLDPSKGGRLGVRGAPYYDTFGSGVDFFKGKLSYSRYLRILQKPNTVLAGRAAFGSIWGEDRDAVPADIRFYAGGGGSIRGYAYQSVGPLERDNPLGGNSLLEFSAELRLRIWGPLGLVAFLDGGNAYEGVIPDLDETLRWGAGSGLRYYSPVGPLRLDAAVPLNPRDEFDDDFQIYLSIGQAF